MPKYLQQTRRNTRYEPYPATQLAQRRRGPSPPSQRSNRAPTYQEQLNSRVFKFFEDLYKRHGAHDLCDLFNEHASWNGPFSQAVGTWLRYHKVRLFAHTFVVTTPD
jgi:hypothetical protein